jgi:hypothetical protein
MAADSRLALLILLIFGPATMLRWSVLAANHRMRFDTP